MMIVRLLKQISSKVMISFLILQQKNANRAKKDGLITPGNVIPYPKNPIIANFFRNIGYSDKLGSGVRKVFTYSEKYSGADPIFAESDVFRITVPLDDNFSWDAQKTSDTVKQTSQVDVSDELKERIAKLGKKVSKNEIKAIIIELCKIKPRTRKEFADILTKSEEYLRKEILPGMLGTELSLLYPESPNSPNQAYKVK